MRRALVEVELREVQRTEEPGRRREKTSEGPRDQGSAWVAILGAGSAG